MKLNVGCGGWQLPGWVNLDAIEHGVPGGVVARAPSLPFLDASLEEIYAGHFVEHLEYEEAVAFLAECRRCLTPGGVLGVVVPDTDAILKSYLNGPRKRIEFLRDGKSVFFYTDDLDDLCAVFLYSTVQDSQHRWSYNPRTLARLLESNGFRVEGEINRWFDRRIPIGTWYQCGWQARKEA